MKSENIITVLVILIALISAFAAGIGIFSNFGEGAFNYESIHGNTIEIYGKGIYQYMSADVAIQGIAQDYITFFVAVPLLIFFLVGYRKKSKRAQFLLAGTLGYFLVTYLFYTTMGMYNFLFLAYVVLLGLAFFSFFITAEGLRSFKARKIFSANTPTKFVGGVLIANSVLIAFLWLNIIITPLIDGSIYPKELNHYTTLIVQGLDLGLLLPICFVVGYLLIQKRDPGYIYATIYIIFLSFLMTALTAKVIAMALNDVNVIPVIFIIPTINIITIVCAALMVKNVQTKNMTGN